MQEILDKVQKLYDSMVSQSKALEKKLQLASQQMQEAEEVAQEQKRALKIVQDKEKELKGIEDAIALSAKADAQLKEAQNVRISAESQIDEYTRKSKALDKKEADLAKLQETYKAKHKSLDAEKVQLEEDRKNMRASILDELKKK